MRFIYAAAKFLLNKLVGKRAVERVATRLVKMVDSDPLLVAYHNMGILKWEDKFVSGEQFVIDSVLRTHLKSAKPTFFDVGGNVGDYSVDLRQAFPTAVIFAFEPNINTYRVMVEKLAPLEIVCLNLGLSSRSDSTVMYTYEDDLITGHASVYRDALSVLHRSNRIREVEFKSMTLDEFAEQHHVDFIDFLKIDTEGHEMDILRGATRMLAGNKIRVIQFEFNEMNIVSRVFLKDFYDLLEGFSFYRLDSNRLIGLGAYQSINEIFKFQNLLAVNDRLGRLSIQ